MKTEAKPQPATEETPTKPEEPASLPMERPLRTRAVIQEELARARARFRELHPLIEADTAKLRRSQERLAAALRKHKQAVQRNPDSVEEFDYTNFQIFSPDEVLQREFHRLHYQISDLEQELEALARDRGRWPA